MREQEAEMCCDVLGRANSKELSMLRREDRRRSGEPKRATLRLHPKIITFKMELVPEKFEWYM